MDSPLSSETLFIAPDQFAAMQNILASLENSIRGGMAIGGSLTQRAMIPGLAKSLEEKPLHDIDIVLLGGSKENCPVLPSIKNDFRISHIYPVRNSYYFLIHHKKSGMMVDLFSTAYPQKLSKISIGGNEYYATSLEEQVLYLARDIVERSEKESFIKQGWIDRTKFLFETSELDHALVESIFQDHKRYYSEAFTNRDVSSTTADEFIAMALKTMASPGKPNNTQPEYPNDCIVTSNGISIDQ